MSKEILRVESKIIYTSGRVTVREDVVEYIDGHQEKKEILQIPEGVLILPVTSTGKIILTQEFRHNHGGVVLGVPMGKKENTEQALEAAQRELLEETGLTAQQWTLISTHHNGVHEEGLHNFYIAQELIKGIATPEEDEDIEVIEVTFEEAFQMMENGSIPDIESRACIWAAYIALNKSSSN